MTCLCCAGSTSRRSVGSTSLDICSSCGSATLTDQGEPSDYWGDSLDHVSTFWTDAKERYFASVLALLDTEAPGKRLLDVGGGVGHFAHLAQRRGWDASSLDVSPAATREARRLLGEDRALSDLSEVEPESCDAITMWCVLAHLRDPGDLLTAATEKLRPGGVLWITTPNFAFHKPYGKLRAVIGRPIDFAADDHRIQFTRRGLEALGARSDLEGWTWHYQGIVEFCAITQSRSPVLLAGKKLWNRGAAGFMRLGGATLTSELQGVARKRPSAMKLDG